MKKLYTLNLNGITCFEKNDRGYDLVGFNTNNELCEDLFLIHFDNISNNVYIELTTGTAVKFDEDGVLFPCGLSVPNYRLTQSTIEKVGESLLRIKENKLEKEYNTVINKFTSSDKKYSNLDEPKHTFKLKPISNCNK